jgi:hypothetical protein
MRARAYFGTIVATVGLAATSCGTTSGGNGHPGPSGESGTGTGSSGSAVAGTSTGAGASGTGTGSAATGTSLSGGLSGSISGPPTDAGVTDAFVGCASTSVKATLLPLDLFFLLDTSLSMDDLVSAQSTKWQAVTAAIQTFINDSASAGLGVGLSYFPKTAPGVPSSCTSSADCGAAGPCFIKTCQAPSTEVVACDSESDCEFCTANGQCELYPCATSGICANEQDTFCTVGTPCGMDANGFDRGDCVAATASFCTASDDCTATDYQTPTVPIASLPGNANAISTWLTGHQPLGNTPTQAALQGAITGAQAYATAHPGDTVAVVLATDGQPDEIASGTQCTNQLTAQAADNGVSQVAATGLAATPSIKTFAIGVFTPADLTAGTTVLDAVATQGGTSQPFIIGANASVEQQFTAALASIRGTSLPCNYAVPTPASGSPDFSEINVSLTSGGTTSTVYYVETASACDPMVGGWYYNVDPATGGMPTTIEMCPASCTALKTDAMGEVDVILGCKTESFVPR